MQLHACLLLFIITTDKTLASSLHRCGGNVSLDQEPAGHINLTLPGLFSNTSRLNSMNQQSDKTLQGSVCTWIIDIPLGRTVLLKLVWMENGLSLSVRCVWNEEDQVLASGEMTLLSGCDRNKASLTFTGAGRPSNAIQLVYYVQEDEKNSSEDRSTLSVYQNLLQWSQTGTSFTSSAPIGPEVVRGTAAGIGHLHKDLESSFGPQSVSSVSSQDHGLLHPTSPQGGLPIASRSDRETLPLPEESPNNGADTSGAAHLADGSMTATERTRPYFHHGLSTDTKSNTANPSDPHTLITLADAAATLLGTDTLKYSPTPTPKQTDEDATMQNDQSGSSPNVLRLTSSAPELHSRMTWEHDAILTPRGRAVGGTPGEKQSQPWRSHRSTDGLNSDLTPTTTSDPLPPSTKPPQSYSSSAHTDTEPTSSSSSSQGTSRTHSSAAHITDLDTAVGSVEAASVHPNISRNDSFISAASDVTVQTVEPESTDKFENTEMLHALHTSSTESLTHSPQSTETLTHSPYASSPFTQTSYTQTPTAAESTQRHFMNEYVTANTISSSSPDITKDDGRTLGFTSSFSTSSVALIVGGVAENSPGTTGGTYTLHPTPSLLHDNAPTDTPSPVSLLSSSTSADSPTPSYKLQTHRTFLDISLTTLPSSVTQPTTHTTFADHKTTSVQSSHAPHTLNPLLPPTNISPTHKQSHNFIATTQTSLLSTIRSEDGHGGEKAENGDKLWQSSPSSTTTAGPPQQPPPRTTPRPSQENHLTLATSALTSTPAWSSTKSPKFYIVPDQPVAIRVQSIELLLQIVVEESRAAFNAGVEVDTAAWVEPYLQRAPGFSRLLGVWSSGHAVQSLVEFKTSEALQWLSMAGPASLLERTGLARAVREGRTFRSSKITNITLGGLQGDVCEWLLQCPAGYQCAAQPGTANYSCSSVCRFDYCHHHGICTHHPGQLPVCRCLAGDDFWYMGQRCDMRMTRARLVGACLAILVIMVTVIGVLAFVAVRRYRAILIQAKVDQTRSSYRRFNHFDELSGRFWLRSWAGSADSLDNPAFTRSDELLHLRALDRPCCYHDDTLSLPSTCPSHGTHINTIYPHSSQYGWRGSEMSVGEGVLDSGKASDLSVCSWPVEPIHWTPFPLLQQLASHRTPTVRVSRPRSYCEGMELVDLGKSWTA